jgi:hypothetical protein
MNDTDHAIRHLRVHLGDRANPDGRGTCATQNGQDGQETSFGTRGENFGEAGEEGRNYLLQLRLQHLLQLVMRISLGKTRK